MAASPLPVVPGTYRPPKITGMSVRRCDSTGAPTETGRYLSVATVGEVSKVPNANGQETNTLTRKIGYRKRWSTTAWTETTVANNMAPDDWGSMDIIGQNQIAETSVWEVRVTVQDAYSDPIVRQVTVPVSQVAFSIGRDGIGVGKTWQNGSLDVSGNATVDGLLSVRSWLYAAGDVRVKGSLYLADPNEIVINDKSYQRTGRMTVTRPTLSAIGGGYAASWTVNPPFVPPTGWGFQAHTPETTGWVFVFFADEGQLTNGKLTLRFWGNASTTPLYSVGWTLVKL